MAVEYDPKTISGAYGIGAEAIDSTISEKDVAARNAKMKTALEAVKEPLQAFAILCAYFSGQQFRKMEEKITEYEEKKNDYERVLTVSQKANVYLSEAKAADGKGDKDPDADEEFYSDIDWVLNDTGKDHFDISPDSYINEDEAESFLKATNHKKDMLSTDLQALATEVDMVVQDQAEAEEMAANAVKKLVDLLSAIGRTAGG